MGPTARETGTLAAGRNGSNRVRNSNTLVNHPMAYPGRNASSENSAKPAEIPIRSDIRKWMDSQLSGVTVAFWMLLPHFLDLCLHALDLDKRPMWCYPYSYNKRYDGLRLN